jgi:hypothetical protein
MKTNHKFTVLRLLVLGVLVAGFSAKPANAQAFQGKFTLPSATRWGQATLPAGDYSFTLNHAYAEHVVTVIRGTHPVALIVARFISNTTSGRSEMVLENGKVRKLSLPQIGMTFEYPASNPRHRAAPREPQLAQVIPVANMGAGR